ncbi:MAG: DNA mismatch repair protein MutS [Candidatus Omnitrophica bacterium]|nr:DNA mismatch repair protein MutS [Candidatus Omnitrophota bacterium]
MENLTPMLQQYQQVKKQHPDSILFFRLGDFYEMFYDDARKACGILDVVLTSRDAGKSGKAPMCGIPYHAADTYIAKLIKAGLKVAICEQVEDPALAKGIVKREVIRVITSGTYIDEASFEARSLASLAFVDEKIGLAFIDTASGTLKTQEYSRPLEAIEILAKNFISECIFPLGQKNRIQELFKHPALRNRTTSLSPFEDWAFNVDLSRKTLCEHLHTLNLRGFGIEEIPAAIASSGALLEYLKQMHKQPLRHIDKISLCVDNDYVFISPAAVLGLDLDNLLKTIDHTRCPLGRRKLKDWLYHPLKGPSVILKRQEAISLLRNEPVLAEDLGRMLADMPDIEKSISRISCAISSARDLLALRHALLALPKIAKIIFSLKEKNNFFDLLDIPNLREYLERSVSPEIPLSHPEGKIINRGFNQELDSLRDIRENGNGWLKNLQAKEIQHSKINSLKIGFNSVFGYYIEISKSNLDRVPAEYIRKQTLVNAERFITQELKDFEEKMLTADEKILKIESSLIAEIHKVILDNVGVLHEFSWQIATLDCLYSLCSLSRLSGYICPKIIESPEIDIKDGRHPMVEKSIPEPFIPNDTFLDCSQNHLVILTGPNMAGKSTYIRQTAILVILARIVDKIFTRIGAHDEITKGQSTFMVEMSETAGILNNLSERSLVVLDEIGRGTSTFDGLSLAWAIAEYLAKHKIRALFATHFHELTALAEEFSGVKNFNVSVKEWNDEIIFLHKIVPGGTDDSYGIYVAKLTGIPVEVVKRAQKILTRLEISDDLQAKIRNRIPEEEQISLFNKKNNALLEKIKDEIANLDVNSLTPLEALNKLQQLKKKVGDNE